MHRLYSSFPNSWPGLSLLLLRAMLGITLIVQGCAYLQQLRSPTAEWWIVCLFMLAIGVSLIAGFLTPLASAAALLGSLGVALSWFPTPSWNLFSGNLLSGDVIVIAVAAIFLGPGAFSLDARLFGRRKVIIPRVSLSPKS